MLKKGEEMNVIFRPAQRKIEFVSRLFEYERTNVNFDEYRLCFGTWGSGTIKIEFE